MVVLLLVAKSALLVRLCMPSVAASVTDRCALSGVPALLWLLCCARMCASTGVRFTSVANLYLQLRRLRRGDAQAHCRRGGSHHDGQISMPLFLSVPPVFGSAVLGVRVRAAALRSDWL
jgi:hypothetical protein